MGRTIRTFREVVDIENAMWKNFRRQLKPDDRERLDKIFDYARMHADSTTVISIPHKIDVVFMSVLIEMQRRIDELELLLSQQSNPCGKDQNVKGQIVSTDRDEQLE